MNTRTKELLNDVLTGLAVAGTFAAVMPAESMAQLSTAVTNAQAEVAAPFVQIVSYISYGMGAVFTIAGIAGAKKHADNPQTNPLNPALGKLGAGAAFLAAPVIVGMLQTTGNTTTGDTAASFSSIGGI